MPAKIAICVACLALGASANIPAADGPVVDGEDLELCNFTLRHADEFDDLSVSNWELDGKRWTAHTPWRGDFGDAGFADPGPDGPFAIKDGILQITARQGLDGKWQSGLLAAADDSGEGWGIQYGYFEARMKMPAGPGTWPAFWLISLQPIVDGAPPIVELDVVEYYGHDDASFHSVWHIWFRPPHESLNRGDGEQTSVPAGSLVEEFHDYGVRVEPEQVTYYLDRSPVFSHPTPEELTTPMYPLVNLAMGSGWPIDETPNPSTLEVDYVRIYAPLAEDEEAGC